MPLPESTHGRQPGTLTSLATNREQKTRALLAELGIPPENAAITLDAAKEALLKVMPKSRKEAMTREQLQDAAVVPTKNTACRALNQLLALGKIQRIGEGWKGSPYRYFATDHGALRDSRQIDITPNLDPVARSSGTK
jgi:hypothetical protein